jgi:hypothetical protein
VVALRPETWEEGAERADIGADRRLILPTTDHRNSHKVIAMTVRYAHLAPKHTLGAVERLEASTECSTDTTPDTGVLQRPAMQTAVLQ